MKLIIALSASTRGGIDFFQSLLDKHSQISQFPGEIYIDELLMDLKDVKSIDKISDIFVNKYKRYFNSSISIIEKHNQLGKNKNQFYNISITNFKSSLKNLLEGKPLTKINIIKYLHLAYSKVSGEEISKKKIILLQIHHLYRIKSIIDLDFEIICTIRDPIGSYNSYIKNLAFFRKKTPSPWQFYYHLDRTFNHLNNIINLKKKLSIIKLEDLHRENERVMKKFCNYFEIEYENTLHYSTFHGLLWWGDQVSKKDLNGINKNFENIIDEKNFFKNDIKFIENKMDQFINKYSYKSRYDRIKSGISKYFPLKFELKMLMINLLYLNFKNFLFVIYYYFKRLILMTPENKNKTDLPKKL